MAMYRLNLDSNSKNLDKYYRDERSQTLIRRQQGVLAIKILSRTMRAVQKHRGASIAVINGDEHFLALTESLNAQIISLFQVMDVLAAEQAVLSLESVQLANADWAAIERGWRQDTVISNYEFHCHLVDTLRRMANQTIERWILNGQDSSGAFAEGVRLTLFEIPEHIELMAKLRGLSTHAASSRRCDDDTRIRLSFLIKHVDNEYRRLYPALKELTGPLAGVEAFDRLPRQQEKLEQLLEIIQRRIIDAARIRTDGSRIFNLSTETIDLYWETVEQALQIIENELLEQHFG